MMTQSKHSSPAIMAPLRRALRPLAHWARRSPVAMTLAGTLLFLLTGTALAAAVAGSEEVYILPKGQVVSDDLYVSAREVLIEGTVEGDLVAAGAYIEVSGVVMGDVIAAGAGIVVSGAVQDDARLAGGGIVVSGSVGDDLFAAGGGGWPAALYVPMRIDGREVPQGVQFPGGASVGGDAYIVGGSGALAGSVGGNLFAGMNQLVFAGSVAGDADLNAARLTVAEAGRVQGTLRYSSSEAVGVPEAVATSVERKAWETQVQVRERKPVQGFLWWVVRTAVVIVGLWVIGWLALTFAPNALAAPLATLTREPAESGILGMVAAVAVLPVSAALVFLAILVWGWFPGGVAMAALLLGLVGVVWLVSPALTGLWLGRKLGDVTGAGQGDLVALLLGIALIVLVGRLLALIPCVGPLAYRMVYLLSFALAVGSWLMTLRRKRVPQAAPAA